MVDYTYNKDFVYTHDNPYHEKLEEFSEFVLRDSEAEQHQGNWNKGVFKRPAPLYVEIGSGYGHFMLEFCQNNPDINFVGMDYRFKRTFNLAKKLSQNSAKNFRYLRAKGERIQHTFGEHEVDRIFYFFPDPWPKKRHLKKRLFQQQFLDAAYKILKPQGEILVKTDHDGYAQWMKEVIDNNDQFELVFHSRDLRAEHPEHFLSSFQTKFEKIFVEQKVKIKAFTLKSLKV